MNRFIQLFFAFSMMSGTAHGVVAGGRPNSISGGQNAFAGVVNPANAVWIQDRVDLGAFLIRQHVTFDNKNNNPFFTLGKSDQTYKAKYICTGDAAIHKLGKIKGYECSISLATYTTPGSVKIRTKQPVPIVGNTPVHVLDYTRGFSSIFSFKLNQNHSIGFSLDYFYLTHLRNGFQHADNALRSVSPGNVTNNGKDHSHGLGLTLGWRWNISKTLAFGLAYIKKSYLGQYRKYRGYEPHHARNYIPQTVGGGFTYRFNEHIAGRLEALWTNFGNLPNANNAILPNGNINTNKRGSNKSSGAGLQNATIINMGLGYRANENLSFGTGLSHRIKRSRHSPYIIAHSYMRQVIYNLATLGVNFKYQKHEFFITLSHGFQNRQAGTMPQQIGGGKFVSKKNFNSLSIAWGYLY